MSMWRLDTCTANRYQHYGPSFLVKFQYRVPQMKLKVILVAIWATRISVRVGARFSYPPQTPQTSMEPRQPPIGNDSTFHTSSVRGCIIVEGMVEL